MDCAKPRTRKPRIPHAPNPLSRCSQDNFEVNGSTQAPGIDNQFLDMIEVPFWDKVKNPNGPVPDVQLLMDFRGMDIDDFVYHCHILSHEDLGMMAIIRVKRDE